jgi:hypothetical protein
MRPLRAKGFNLNRRQEGGVLAWAKNCRTERNGLCGSTGVIVGPYPLSAARFTRLARSSPQR